LPSPVQRGSGLRRDAKRCVRGDPLA
jgi:hypothetical protein